MNDHDKEVYMKSQESKTQGEIQVTFPWGSTQAPNDERVLVPRPFLLFGIFFVTHSTRMLFLK